MVLSSTLPTVGAGALKNREDPKVLGTSKVGPYCRVLLDSLTTCMGHRNPASCKPRRHFIKPSPSNAHGPKYPLTCSCSALHIRTLQVLVSTMFKIFPAALTRLLACLPHYTSGQTYFYPAFNAARSEDAIKFAHEFGEVLAMPIMLEAVQRVRASRGMFPFVILILMTLIDNIREGLRMASFHGNFFVRSTDLLAMPAVPQDQSYAIEIQIEDTITTPFVMFQVAVLHTTCYGQPVIRCL